MELLGPTSRTDLTDTQFVSAARALELQLRGRVGGSNGTVRPLRESERRDVPRNIRLGVARHMLPDGPSNSARLTTWELLKAEIDNVRRAQAAPSSTPQPMDLSAYGTQELDSFQKGKSRGGKGKGKGKDKGKPKDNVPTTPCPICGEAGHWKKRLLVQHSWWLGGHEQAQGQEQGQRRQGQDPCQQSAAVEQRQEEYDVLELRRYGTPFQSMSE